MAGQMKASQASKRQLTFCLFLSVFGPLFLFAPRLLVGGPLLVTAVAGGVLAAGLGLCACLVTPPRWARVVYQILFALRAVVSLGALVLLFEIYFFTKTPVWVIAGLLCATCLWAALQTHAALARLCELCAVLPIIALVGLLPGLAEMRYTGIALALPPVQGVLSVLGLLGGAECVIVLGENHEPKQRIKSYLAAMAAAVGVLAGLCTMCLFVLGPELVVRLTLPVIGVIKASDSAMSARLELVFLWLWGMCGLFPGILLLRCALPAKARGRSGVVWLLGAVLTGACLVLVQGDVWKVILLALGCAVPLTGLGVPLFLLARSKR